MTLINLQVIRNTFNSFIKPDQQVPPALVTDLLRRYSTKEGYDLYPDVKDFFSRLQDYKSSSYVNELAWPFEKIVVGIITNSDDRVPGILESFGLKINSRRFNTSSQPTKYTSTQDDIDFVILSYDVGHEKPERRIFSAATSMLTEIVAGNKADLPSEDFEKLYVGDDLEKDYDGARAAGWHALLLDRNGVMDRARGFRLGRVGLQDKEGKERKVLLARSLLDVEMWKPMVFEERRHGNLRS